MFPVTTCNILSSVSTLQLSDFMASFIFPAFIIDNMFLGIRFLTTCNSLGVKQNILNLLGLGKMMDFSIYSLEFFIIKYLNTHGIIFLNIFDKYGFLEYLILLGVAVISHINDAFNFVIIGNLIESASSINILLHLKLPNHPKKVLALVQLNNITSYFFISSICLIFFSSSLHIYVPTLSLGAYLKKSSHCGTILCGTINRFVFKHSSMDCVLILMYFDPPQYVSLGGGVLHKFIKEIAINVFPDPTLSANIAMPVSILKSFTL